LRPLFGRRGKPRGGLLAGAANPTAGAGQTCRKERPATRKNRQNLVNRLIFWHNRRFSTLGK
jgi:hypothetical protein